ncbi:hypothetical protein D9M69_687040 [compost metagenome]
MVAVSPRMALGDITSINFTDAPSTSNSKVTLLALSTNSRRTRLGFFVFIMA